MSEIPEPWRTAAEQAGVRQTLRGIADEAKLSHVTVRRLITQGRQYLAVELGMSVPAIMQRMLMLADDPAVIAQYPLEARAIRDAREVGRRRRSGSRLLTR